MKKFLKEYLPYIIIIVVVLLIRTFIATPVRVSGSSMDKTLENGQILLLYKLSELKRDEIVVIKTSEDKIIKRIIAMPNETIKCEAGIIYVNGKEYDDKYAYGLTSDFEEITLKKDEYFVLGDNRLVSQDSRVIGPVKASNIMGTVNIRLYPFNKIGKIQN